MASTHKLDPWVFRRTGSASLQARHTGRPRRAGCSTGIASDANASASAEARVSVVIGTAAGGERQPGSAYYGANLHVVFSVAIVPLRVLLAAS